MRKLRQLFARGGRGAAGQAGAATPMQTPEGQTVVSMLNDMALFPIEAAASEPGSSRLFEQWAAHVATGAAVEGQTPAVTSSRAWTALQDFFSQHRRQESHRVAASWRELRRLLWLFVTAVSRNSGRDRQDDREVVAQLDRLRQAIDSDSLERIRAAAMPAIEMIARVTGDRQRRQAEQLVQLGAQLKELRAELDAARRELTVDPLTRLYNRAAFDTQIHRISDLSVFSGKPACLMMLDIDFFKKVNDTHGHPAGDALLRGIAATFIEAFPRRSDFVARYGGEEFAIVLQEDGLDVARTLAGRLLQRVRDQVYVHGQVSLKATISIGIAELRPGEAAAAWIARADKALYGAKHGGRDRYLVAE